MNNKQIHIKFFGENSFIIEVKKQRIVLKYKITFFLRLKMSQKKADNAGSN